MANGGLTTAIEGPRLTPPKICLVSASEKVEVGENEKWSGGFEYKPDGCGDGQLIAHCPTLDGGTIGDTPITYASGSPLEDFTPYLVVGTDTCSTWGYKVHDYVDRARRRLLASESYWMELVLWGGPTMAGSTIAALGNPVITTGATTVTSGGTTAVKALAALETALGSNQKGNRSMIHMRPGILVELVAASAVHREGNVWLTPMDNIIVPGAGYEGTGPAAQAVGATEWIYATGMVQTRRGPIHLIPSDESDWDQVVGRDVNDISVQADRVVHAALDPNCVKLAAEVTI